ncbi:hypothetical protein V8F06_008651 [Rhypophila decipiens]
MSHAIKVDCFILMLILLVCFYSSVPCLHCYLLEGRRQVYHVRQANAPFNLAKLNGRASHLDPYPQPLKSRCFSSSPSFLSRFLSGTDLAHDTGRVLFLTLMTAVTERTGGRRKQKETGKDLYCLSGPWIVFLACFVQGRDNQAKHIPLRIGES